MRTKVELSGQVLEFVRSLAPEPRGTNGFGWDVIFVPEGEARTFAEMTAEEKNACSHRAKAFAELVRRLWTPE